MGRLDLGVLDIFWLVFVPLGGEGLQRRRGGVIIGCYDTIPYKIRLMIQGVHILPSFHHAHSGK